MELTLSMYIAFFFRWKRNVVNERRYAVISILLCGVGETDRMKVVRCLTSNVLCTTFALLSFHFCFHVQLLVCHPRNDCISFVSFLYL